MLQFTAICVCFVNIDHGKMSNGTFIEGLISNNNAHHMSVSLSGFCFSSIIVSLHMEEQNIFQSNPLDLAVLAYLATTWEMDGNWMIGWIPQLQVCGIKQSKKCSQPKE